MIEDEQSNIQEEAQTAFRGNFAHSVDEKGRVSLPASFRQVLGKQGKVVLTNYVSEGARCLEGFGIEAWEDFERKLRKKSRFDAKLQKLENFYLSRASECQLDGSEKNYPHYSPIVTTLP